MKKSTGLRKSAAAILVLGIAIGYLAAKGGSQATDPVKAQELEDTAQQPAKSHPAVELAQAQAQNTRKNLVEGKAEDSLTPWNDPDDPSVFRFNTDDPSFPGGWNKRNDKPKLEREPGPIDLQRYYAGMMHNAFPTFFGMPVALTTEDLKAGNVEVAIVGSTADMNAVPGTRWAPNVLRGFINSSATYFTARGDGVQERNISGFPMELYTFGSMHELRVVDYGNIAMHQSSGERTVEEIRKVVGEIMEADAIPITVGGSHDGMYGLFLAAADKFGPNNFGIAHFDSHFDGVSAAYGYYVHNGNGMYEVLKRNIVKGEDIVQVGMTSIGVIRDDFKYMVDKGMRYHYQAEIERDGWDTVMRRTLADLKHIDNLLVTVDIDIIASAHMPGTGGREPDGPTPAQMMQMVRALAIQNNVILFDVAEFNPMLDTRSGQSATVVTKLMAHFMAGLAARKRGITDPFYYHPEMIDDGR